LVVLLAGPFLAGCAGDLDPAIRDIPNVGTGGSTQGSGGSNSGSGGATGSGGTTGSGGANPGSGGSSAPCDAQSQVFDNYGCSSSICHGGSTPPTLSGSDVGGALKGMKADSTCMSLSYINSSDPSSSAIVKAVSGTTCGGTRMPVGGQILTQDDINCLVDWMSKLP
jgi:hypothetical protein